MSEVYRLTLLSQTERTLVVAVLEAHLRTLMEELRRTEGTAEGADVRAQVVVTVSLLNKLR